MVTKHKCSVGKVFCEVLYIHRNRKGEESK